MPVLLFILSFNRNGQTKGALVKRACNKGYISMFLISSFPLVSSNRRDAKGTQQVAATSKGKKSILEF